jgi:erythritol transport system ATP-binding protein
MSDQVQPKYDPKLVNVLEPDIILRAEDITKIFPGTVALDHVTFNVYKGKVNVLVGENGAGKSTLMKIIAGVEQPTHGRILLDGEEIRIRSPLDAKKYGISIIFQELNLVPDLTVTENIFLGHEVVQYGTINYKYQRQIAFDLLQHLEQPINPDAKVGNLRIGQQQIVEIAKALAQDVRILIMDEPTSALSATEVEALFRVINELKARGVSIIYISHRLEELLQIGDYLTVLRDGRLIAEELVENVNISWIIEKMVGKSFSSLFRRKEHRYGDVILKVENITLPGVGGSFIVDHVSFDLHQGEILGFYGLMGAGRSDLLDCLAGARPEASGRIWLNGQEIKANTIRERIQTGIVLVPEDRRRDGLVPTLSVADNILLASLRKYLNQLHFLSSRKESAAVENMVRSLSIHVADPQQLITSLSGGNQQKVIVAKGLLNTPKILMLDEPTRGIDVGAKSEIFELMSKLAEEGYGILFVSSELKEILAVSDRIIVMSKGAITDEVTYQEATEERLVMASYIGHKMNSGGNHNVREKYD